MSWFMALGVVFPGDQAGEADKFVRELAGSSPDAADLSGLARMWMTQGPQGGSRAVELARQAVSQCPPDKREFLALLNADLGDFLLATRDVSGAAKAYEETLKVNPDLWSPMNNLAYLKAEMLGDPAGAIPLAERLVQLAPDQASVLDTVGWVYYKNSDLERAKRYLSDSIAINPAADTYVHLAEVLLKSGDRSGAEKQLTEAEKLRPSSETESKIKSLRDDIGRAG
jgi:tetratricopeptide (TPR) repeat protein